MHYRCKDAQKKEDNHVESLPLFGLLIIFKGYCLYIFLSVARYFRLYQYSAS